MPARAVIDWSSVQQRWGRNGICPISRMLFISLSRMLNIYQVSQIPPLAMLELERLLTGIDQEDVIRPVFALICGLFLGWNREHRGRAAGLRTQTLVALGACVFTLAAIHLHEDFPDSRLDPIRVVQGIVGGIGFLGAGSIIRSRGHIRGVTTAATVWVSGAVGMTAGLGYYSLSIVTVVLCLTVLVGCRTVRKTNICK